MRRLILILALATCASAGDEPWQTNGKVNGRYWTGIDDMQKLAYLVAYKEASEAYHQSDTGYFPCSPVILGDILKGIDRIYSDPENLVLPVVDALWIFTAKTRGSSPREIEQGQWLVLQRARGRLREWPAWSPWIVNPYPTKRPIE